MLIVKKIHSQKYVIKAEKGQTSVRDNALKSVFWRHSKFQKGYVFTPRYKNGTWNGKVNLFSATNIKAGFLREALDELEYLLSDKNEKIMNAAYEAVIIIKGLK